MRIKTIKIYQFKELSEEVKEIVINNYRENRDYPWGDDNEKTLNAFVKQFDFIKVSNWFYGGQNDNVYFHLEGDLDDMSAYRFWKYLLNNGYLKIRKLYGKGYNTINDEDCYLTGYCIDCDILDPIVNLVKNPLCYKGFDCYQIIEKCFDSWVKACNNNMESYFSDECIIEDLLSNDTEFTEDGEIA